MQFDHFQNSIQRKTEQIHQSPNNLLRRNDTEPKQITGKLQHAIDSLPTKQKKN